MVRQNRGHAPLPLRSRPELHQLRLPRPQRDRWRPITATFTVTNSGERAGADVAQLYLTHAAGERRLRLLGFERVELQPGETRPVTLSVDPRLLARFDTAAGQWRITQGSHQVAVGRNATQFALEAQAPMTGRLFGS
jgi:beta-glucosidase